MGRLPLLLLPLLPLLILLLILLILLPILGRAVSRLTVAGASPRVRAAALVPISSAHNIVCHLLINVIWNMSTASILSASILTILDLVHGHRDLDGLPPQAGHAVHAGHGGLLLHLVIEPDEAEPLAEPTLVQNNFGRY